MVITEGLSFATRRTTGRWLNSLKRLAHPLVLAPYFQDYVHPGASLSQAPTLPNLFKVTSLSSVALQIKSALWRKSLHSLSRYCTCLAALDSQFCWLLVVLATVDSQILAHVLQLGLDLPISATLHSQGSDGLTSTRGPPYLFTM